MSIVTILAFMIALFVLSVFACLVSLDLASMMLCSKAARDGIDCLDIWWWPVFQFITALSFIVFDIVILNLHIRRSRRR